MPFLELCTQVSTELCIRSQPGVAKKFPGGPACMQRWVAAQLLTWDECVLNTWTVKEIVDVLAKCWKAQIKVTLV